MLFALLVFWPIAALIFPTAVSLLVQLGVAAQVVPFLS